MKKIYIKRVVKCISLLVIVMLFVSISQKYFFVLFCDTKIRMEGFYLEDKNSLDVVLIGSSELYNDYSPGLAYGEYGFTSYSIGTPGGSPALWKTQLKEVLKNQSPHLIVVEINAALFEDDTELFKDATMRQCLDNMPFSINKVETINSLPLEEDVSSYYIPFIKYHGTDDIGSSILHTKTLLQMETRGYSLLKGIYTIPKLETGEKSIDVDMDDSVRELAPVSESYLREFLSYCNSQNIDDIIFTRFPHRINSQEKYERYQRGNMAGKIIAEYGYEFINLEGKAKEIGLDESLDYYDNDHFNIYGQQKFTRYFSKYIIDNYEVNKTELTRSQEKEWENSYEYTKLFYEYVKNIPIDNTNETYIFEDYNVISELKKMRLSKPQS